MNTDVRSFGRLCRTFERTEVRQEHHPTWSRAPSHPPEPVTKKRRIEVGQRQTSWIPSPAKVPKADGIMQLVKSVGPAPTQLAAAVEMPPPPPPPKSKPGRKKARTITEQATAPYAMQQQPTSLELPPLDGCEGPIEKEEQSGVHPAPKKPRKARAGRANRPDAPRRTRGTTKRKSKKDETATTAVLLSPRAALEHIEMQSVAFATSSQLAREPTSPADRQDLARADACIDQGDQLTRSTVVAQRVLVSDNALGRWSTASTSRSLWSAAARDDQGRLAESSVDEVKEAPSRGRDASKQLEPRKTFQPVTDVQHPRVTMPENEGWQRLDDLDSIKISSKSLGPATRQDHQRLLAENNAGEVTKAASTEGNGFERLEPRNNSPESKDVQHLHATTRDGEEWLRLEDDGPVEVLPGSHAQGPKDEQWQRPKNDHLIEVSNLKSSRQRGADEQWQRLDDRNPATVIPRSGGRRSKGMQWQLPTDDEPIKEIPEPHCRQSDVELGQRLVGDGLIMAQLGSDVKRSEDEPCRRVDASGSIEVPLRRSCPSLKDGPRQRQDGIDPVDDRGLKDELCPRLDDIDPVNAQSKSRGRRLQHEARRRPDDLEPAKVLLKSRGQRSRVESARRPDDEKPVDDLPKSHQPSKDDQGQGPDNLDPVKVRSNTAGEQLKEDERWRQLDDPDPAEGSSRSRGQRLRAKEWQLDDVDLVKALPKSRDERLKEDENWQSLEDLESVEVRLNGQGHRLKEGEQWPLSDYLGPANSPPREGIRRVEDERSQFGGIDLVKALPSNSGEWLKEDENWRSVDDLEAVGAVVNGCGQSSKEGEQWPRADDIGPANRPLRDGGQRMNGVERQFDKVDLVKAAGKPNSRAQELEDEQWQRREGDGRKDVLSKSCRGSAVDDVEPVSGSREKRARRLKDEEWPLAKVDLVSGSEVPKSRGQRSKDKNRRLDPVKVLPKGHGQQLKEEEWQHLEQFDPMDILPKGPCSPSRDEPMLVLSSDEETKPASSTVKKLRRKRLLETVVAETDPPSMLAQPRSPVERLTSERPLVPSSDDEMKSLSNTIKKLRRKRITEGVVTETDPLPVDVPLKSYGQRLKTKQLLNPLSDEEKDQLSGPSKKLRLVAAAGAETDSPSIRLPPKRPIQQPKSEQLSMSSSDEELTLPSSTVKRSRRKALLESIVAETDPKPVAITPKRSIQRLNVKQSLVASSDEESKLPSSTTKKSRRKRLLETVAVEKDAVLRPPPTIASAAAIVEKRALPSICQAPPKPDFEGYPTTKLSSTLASYGFKPVKSRKRMITLLEKCWEGQHRVALQALETNTQQAPPDSLPPARRRRVEVTSKISDARTADARPSNGEAGHSAANTTTTIPVVDISTTSLKKPRGRPKKSTTAASPAPVSSRDTQRSRSNKDYVSESEPPSPAPLPAVLQPSRAGESSGSAVTNMLPNPALEDVAPAPANADGAEQQASRFASITQAVHHQRPSASADAPTWHERILMYDPVVLEDLAVWLNTGGFGAVGVDFEVGPAEVKAWCQSKGVCCLWRENLRGGSRRRR